MHTRQTATGVLLVCASCISLQLGAAFAIQLFPHAGPLGTTFMRLAIAALVMLAATRPAVRTWTRQQWRAVIVFGLSLGCMNNAFYLGIERLDLGVAVTFEFLGPLTLAAVLSRRPRDFLYVGLALVGVTLFGFDSSTGAALDPVGVLWVLIAGACWAWYILASAKLGRSVSGAGGLAAGMSVAALLSLPMGITGAMNIVTDPTLLGFAVFMAILGSVIPYACEFYALRRLSPQVFGVLLSLEPMFAALAGLIILSQPIGMLGCIAIACVITASMGATSRPKTKHITGQKEPGPQQPNRA